MRAIILALVVLAAALGPAAAQDTIQSEKGPIKLERMATGLANPWALAFLPDGRMLVTEKRGALRIVSVKGELGAPITGVPKVDARGQGGLLDVALHPEFAQNRLVYLSFSEPGDGGANSTAVALGRLGDDEASLDDVRVIFSQKPKVRSNAHFGSRLAFDGKGHLFVTMGDRFDYEVRENAQTLDNHIGKVVRVNEDGSIPQDNPFVGTAGALPEIWSIGHRNVQAAAVNPRTGALWEIEHGPKGGDEINIAQAGKNYGWPVVSFGKNYDGTPVGSGKSDAEGMEDPIKQWTPVIAPSGMLFYDGKEFPAWSGNLFVGGLRATTLVRLELDGERVVREERLLRDLGHRIRDVAQAPDGSIYVVTDGADGAILRLFNAGD